MATTQYIGARYVPLFAEPAEWDSTKQYEPLTIVLHEGNSYTSKQYVPVGIEITNDKFWALTGNYNAQVEQYRRDVQAFDGRISANATAIDAEKTRAEGAEQTNATEISNEVTRAKEAEQANATAITNEVTRAKEAEQANATAIANEVTRATNAEQTNATAIATETTNRESADTAIRGQITEVAAKGSVMVVIGDSWSSPENGYVKWHDKVAKNLGMTVDNFAVGGSGFVNKPGDTFSDQLDRVHAKYANNPNAIGRIYVQGFVNDLGNNETTLKNAYRAFDTKFASYFPTKGYKFVNASLFPTTTSAQIGTMNNILADMSLSKACSIINAIGCVTPANLQSDGRHPVNDGYKQLGNTVCGSNYLYACNKNQYFTNGFSAPIYSDAVTITHEDFGATNEPIYWWIDFHVNTDNVSKVNNFVDWSSNPLLIYFIRNGYINSSPIYKNNTGAYAGRISATSYSQLGAEFSAPVQPSDSLRVDLSQIFK